MLGETSGRKRARRAFARISVLALLVAGTTLAAHSVAFGAVNCDSVFEGATPNDPIIKSADKTQAYAGQTVTFTLHFDSTGTADNVTADCYRVDDGSNDTLNALVTGFNSEQTNANVGPNGSAQTVTYTITIPDDASLIGHKIEDRAKATSGSVESRSEIISVDIVAAPCTANCSTPSPTPSTTVGPAVSKAPTVVKGVTLGKTGSSQASTMWLGLLFVAIGIALAKTTRGVVMAGVSAVLGTARAHRARHRKQ